jgi:hypothetical protein
VKQETGKLLQKAARAIRDPKFHRWLIAAFGKRVQGDYGIDAVLTPEEVGRMIEQAREFLQEACRFLGATSTGPGPATP